MYKKILYCILLSMLLLAFTGCNKKSRVNDALPPTSAPSDSALNNQTDTIDESTKHEGEMKSLLTGLWVPNEIGTKRPIAYTFNNFKSVSNQWGIGQADLVYECLAEGGITRLLGIGENFSGDRLGSTRSARQYFVSIADEYDAIYVHFGGSTYAYDKLKELGIDEIDGITGKGGTVFYRDKTMKAPHNAFSSEELLQKGIEKYGFDTQYPEGYQSHFTFNKKDADLTNGTAASNKVTVHFSNYNEPYFEYNANDKLYERFQFGAPHVDSLTGKQLAFKNIIIQFVKEWKLDEKGYQGMDIVDATGSGYYITNGKMVEITWKKKEADKWMRYYNEAGEELSINPGKTFIALFPEDQASEVTMN